MSIPDYKDPSNYDSTTMPLINKNGKRSDGKIGVTPGESIVNKDATEMYPQFIKALNEAGMKARKIDNQEVIAMSNEGTVSLAPTKSLIPKQRPTFIEDIFQDARTWPTFTQSIANIESFGGKYDIKGGKNKHYDGKYQFGKIAKDDVIQWRKDQLTKEEIKKLQHTDAGRESFRKDPELQEKIMKMYVSVNHDYLKDYPGYKDATHARKMELLGYAHNQGATGTKTYLSTGVDGKDENGTKGSKYSREINKNINDAFRIENYDRENTPIPNLAQVDAAEEAAAGVPRGTELRVPEVATESNDSGLFSGARDFLSNLSMPAIPGYTGQLGYIGHNEGVVNMGGISHIEFMKKYKGDLSKLDPDELTPEIMRNLLIEQDNAANPQLKTDEVMLQSSSQAGANSFLEAGIMQQGNPRTSIPIPGTGISMTDSAQLRGGNVRPDMMPPGYAPVPRLDTENLSSEILPINTLTKEQAAQRKLLEDNKKLTEETLPPLNNPTFEQLTPYARPMSMNLGRISDTLGIPMDPGWQGIVELGTEVDPNLKYAMTKKDYIALADEIQSDPNFTGKIVDGMVVSSDEPNAVKIPVEDYDPEYGFEGWNDELHMNSDGTGGGGYAQDVIGAPGTDDYPGSYLGYQPIDSEAGKKASMLANSERADTALHANQWQVDQQQAYLAKEERKLAVLNEKHQSLLDQAQTEIKTYGSVSQDTRAKLEASSRDRKKSDLQDEIDKIKANLEGLQEVGTETSKQLRAQWQSENQGNSALGLESLTFEEWVQKKYPDTGINDALTKALDGTGIEVNFPSSDGANLQIDKIIQDIPGKITPEDITTDNITGATSEGTKLAEKNPGMFEKAKTFLSGIFGDLFDMEELKRAAILYLGARVLGFSGNTAAQFAAKTYLTREENYNDHIRKLVEDGDYTPESIQKFKKSKDRSDLVRVGTPTSTTGVTKVLYRRAVNGDLIKVVASEVLQGKSKYLVDQRTGKKVLEADYQVASMYDRNTPEGRTFQKAIHDQTAAIYKEMNAAPRIKDGDPESFYVGLKNQAAATDITNFAIDNGLSLAQASALTRVAFEDAKSFRLQQLTLHKRNKEKAAKVKSLTPFLHNAYINEQIRSNNRFDSNNIFHGTTQEQRKSAMNRTFSSMNNNAVMDQFNNNDKAQRDKLIASGVSEEDANRRVPNSYDRFMANRVYRETIIAKGAAAHWVKISEPQINDGSGTLVTNPDYNEALTAAVKVRANSNKTTFVYELMLMELDKK